MKNFVFALCSFALLFVSLADAATSGQFLSSAANTNNYSCTVIGEDGKIYGARQTFDATGGAIEFAVWDGMESQWMAIPDSALTGADVVSSGLINQLGTDAMKVDSSGDIHIALNVGETRETGATVNLPRRIFYGFFEVSEGSWTFTNLLSVPGTVNPLNGGQVMLLDSSGVPHVVYGYSQIGGNDWIFHRFLDQGSWTDEELVQYNFGASRISEISGIDAVIDGSDDIHVSFVLEDTDKVSGDIWYARRSEGTWEEAKEVADADDQVDSSIAVDPGGNVHIGYAQAANATEFIFKIVSNPGGSFAITDAGKMDLGMPDSFFAPSSVNLAINGNGQRVISGSYGSYDSNFDIEAEGVVISAETSPGNWVVETFLAGNADNGTFGLGSPPGSMCLTDDDLVMVLQGTRNSTFGDGQVQYAVGVPEALNILNTPVIGISQNVSVSGDAVTFDLYLENLGPAVVESLSAAVDLDAIFGAGNYLLTSGPSLESGPNTVLLDNTFNGSALTEIFASGASLDAGLTARIRIQVFVNQLSDSGGGLGSYTNQVTITGQSPTGIVRSDLSDNGSDPDPNGNGDPTEAGENDRSVFAVAERPVIGVAESVSVTGDEVTFDFYLESFGNVPLQGLVMPIDLDDLFGAGNYSVTSGPGLIGDPGSINLNGSFDGSSDLHIVAAGSGVPFAGTAQIQLVVEVSELTDSGSGFGVYSSRVSAMAQSPNATTAADDSDNGTDPDPNGNGDPTEAGENDATPITITQRPVIGISRNVSVSGRRVTLDTYLENFGNVPVEMVSVPVDLDAVFGAGNYTVNSGPRLIDDPGTLAVNSSFNGSGNNNLVNPASSSLDYAETAQIQFVVDVTTVTDQGLGLGLFSTQTTATGQSQDGTTTSDLSDDGTDPDPDGDGNPGGEGEDDPTSAELQGTIGDFVWDDLDGDGIQEVGEPGIPGITVYLDSNGNGVLDGGESAVVSDASGAYDITDATAGNYQVRFDLATVPPGFVQTGGNLPTAVTLFAGEDFNDADFGFSLPETPSLTVNSTDDDEDQFDEVTTLREALAYAATLTGPQEITFSDGAGGTVDFTDSTAETITLGGTGLSIAGDVTITGPGAEKLTVSGGNASRVFLVKPGTICEISGLTVADGSADNGGGISSSGDLTISDAVIADNTASAEGGGIITLVPGTLTVRRTVIRDNASENGGGISSKGDVLVSASTISGNTATGSGGGFYAGAGFVRIFNTTISDNSAGDGGAVHVRDRVSLTNSTISDNSSSGSGGGINSDGRSTVTLENTIVANSTGGDIDSQGTINATGSLIEDGLSAINGTNVDNLTGDPLLGPLQDNGGPTFTHALLDGGPAIDSGRNALALDANGNPLATDQRGFARIQQGDLATGSGVVDMGAYELFSAPTFTEDMPSLTVKEDPIDLNAVTGPMPSGGTFSGTGVSGGQFDPAGLDPGEYTVTYTITGGFGGTNSSTFILTLAEAPSLTVTTALDTLDNLDALTSLREALAYAATLTGPQEITFSDGAGGTVDFTDDIPDIIALGGTELSVLSDVTITGPGARKLTLSGGSASRIFDIAFGVVSGISGMTLTDGIADQGGAIFNAGDLTVADSELQGNRAINGNGGAVSSDNYGTLKLVRSTISGNSASGNGGGLHSVGVGQVTVINSTISGNDSARGGGVDVSGMASLTNSTVSGNMVTGSGGGIYVGAGTLKLNNSIVANSSGGDLATGGAGTVDAENSLIEDGLASVNGINVDNLAGDPLLGPLRDNGGPTFTHALIPGSPALDAGSDALALNGSLGPLATDQRGQTRIQQGLETSSVATVDIGAFELFAPPVLTGQPPAIPIAGTPFDLTSVFGTEPVGGDFSGPGVVQNVFFPALAGPGFHEIIYTFTDSSGVINRTTATIQVLVATSPPDVTDINSPDFVATYRPDLRNGRSGNVASHDGNNIYGVGQILRGKSSKKSESFYFSVENDGNASDTIRSSASISSKRKFDVRIVSRGGAGNVTARLLAGGYVENFGAGQISGFKVQVRPKKSGLGKSVFGMRVQSGSGLQPTVSDANDFLVIFKGGRYKRR